MSKLKDWELRLLNEEEDIKNKLTSLEHFLSKGVKDESMSSLHYNLLNCQLDIMKSYYRILKIRIIDLNLREEINNI